MNINVRVHVLQALAMLFKKKRQLLNSHILHLTFSLVGTMDSGRENTIIPNKTAFNDLLCDLEVSVLFDLFVLCQSLATVILQYCSNVYEIISTVTAVFRLGIECMLMMLRSMFV